MTENSNIIKSKYASRTDLSYAKLQYAPSFIRINLSSGYVEKCNGTTRQMSNVECAKLINVNYIQSFYRNILTKDEVDELKSNFRENDDLCSHIVTENSLVIEFHNGDIMYFFGSYDDVYANIDDMQYALETEIKMDSIMNCFGRD